MSLPILKGFKQLPLSISILIVTVMLFSACSDTPANTPTSLPPTIAPTAPIAALLSPTAAIGVTQAITTATSTGPTAKPTKKPRPTATSTPLPAPFPASKPVPGGYWHTDGAKILDENNKQVRITGINWFGFETGNGVVYDLTVRSYKDYMDQIKSLGYNTIRLPYSNDLLHYDAQPSIDYTLNPEMKNLTGLQRIDKIIEYAGQINLRVIIDRHRPDSAAQSELWYTSMNSEEQWLNDWTMLTTHYKDNPTIIGADLHNEPHGTVCWGCGNKAIDWRLAAERAGNSILAINPKWLIFVEGIDWGDNLRDAEANPIRLNVANQLVYEAHTYGKSIKGDQPEFKAANYPDNMPDVWDRNWGYLVKKNIAPVMLGEFGSTLETESDRLWMKAMVKYLGTGVGGISWTYWDLNPNSTDTGGILTNDWKTVDHGKQDLITPIEVPLNE